MIFYRKYRPQKLSDLIGQEAIAKAILASLTSGKISQGYLFWGPKGTGKTSTARILAKAVNCEEYKGGVYGEPCGKCDNCRAILDGSFIDLIEIDAASNRGIDEIRDLREKVKLAPAIGKFKVYIIDEVHMLTTEAFNALLKTLEEPPAHVIFILATTEYNKLPATITSRLAKYNFKRATKESLVKTLERTAKEEKLNVDKNALLAIADASEGSYRDALSILDQVSSTGSKVTLDEVGALVRSAGQDRILKFVNLLGAGKLKETVLFLDEFSELGFDVSVFVKQVILLFEKLLYIKIGLSENDLDWDVDFEKMREIAGDFSTSQIKKLISIFATAESEMQFYPLAHIPLVLAVCKFMDDIGEDKLKNDMDQKSEVAKVNSPLVKQQIKSYDDEAHKKAEVLPQKKTEKVEETKDAVRKTGGSITEVEKNWGEFLNRVRPMNAHVFALLKSTKPTVWDGEALVLEVFYRFHKDKLEEPKIMKMLDSQLEDLLGKKVRLKFTLAKRESMPTIAVSKSDVVEAGSSGDLEKMANEIFSK